MKFRVMAALAVVLCFAVFFQNCGMQVRFASTEGKLLAKNVSDISEDGTDETEEQVKDELGVTPLSSPGETESPTPTPTSTPEQNGEVVPTATPTAAPTATPNDSDVAESEDDGGGPLNFVCVLEGPGRSILLGYIDSETIGGSTSTPETICTTKRGCEEIAGQKFEVKEALEREYCEKNKNVIKVTEEVLRTLVDGE